MSELRVPRVPVDSPAFEAMCRLTSRLMASGGSDEEAHARLQAGAARLYGLDAEEFGHVLDTFPLVPERRRRAARDAFGQI
jgi:hypothetical protein